MKNCAAYGDEIGLRTQLTHSNSLVRQKLPRTRAATSFLNRASDPVLFFVFLRRNNGSLCRNKPFDESRTIDNTKARTCIPPCAGHKSWRGSNGNGEGC